MEYSKLNKLIVIALTLMLTGFKADCAVAADTPDIYHLHQGDKVLISVWREETLQREVVVLPDAASHSP
jgi:hypothetical protein